MKTNQDLDTLNAMSKYGGGFVKALANAGHHADSNNLERIKRTWPEYWKHYAEMAESLARK